MNQLTDPHYDVIIVGGGPAGLNAALILARACRRIVVIDAGHPRNEAAHELHGFLSRDGIGPCELRAAGQRDLAKYGCFVVQDVVLGTSKVSGPGRPHFSTAFEVHTQKGQTITGRKLLFATGMCDQLPDFPGVRECYGHTIHHCPYCDGWEHRNKRLLAYGEDVAKAVGLGIALRGWSTRVTVLTNGKAVSAAHRSQLGKNGIEWADERLLRFAHEDNRLKGVELQSRSFLPASAMFFNTGQHSRCDLPRSLGVECDDEFAGHTSRKQKTNVPGLFIAGDADGEVEFAIVAAAEGATAAVAINRELQDEDRA